MGAAALDAAATQGRVVSDDDALLRANARDLETELNWLIGVIDRRFRLYFQITGEEPAAPVEDVLGTPPALDAGSAYARLVAEERFQTIERLALILSLAPHLRPQLLDVFHTRNQTFDRRFTEFGAARSGPDGDLWPTLDMLAFLAGGADLETRFRLLRLIEPGHGFARLGLLRPHPSTPDEPIGRSPLRIGEDWLHLLTVGTPRRPLLGTQFPAQRLSTSLTWEDLVLQPSTRQQIGEIEAWLRHGAVLMRDWGMARLLRPGYRALFYGPPGTGKTMTAGLLGRSTGREIFRIDLAHVVSKFIGETEKNLAHLFDLAQDRGCILFFDEADALFGKRSETRDAHDRYANQEVSYLLQRIENFDGIAILASNFRENIDEAFARRFESVIYFPLPRPEERLRLWRQGLPARARLDPDVDLEALARTHSLSGAAIMSAIRHACLRAITEGGRPIAQRHLLQAIRREGLKEGRAA
jgi:AAA+ superfamily predicted ATPase